MINRKKSINGFSRSIAFNEDGIARERERGEMPNIRVHNRSTHLQTIGRTAVCAMANSRSSSSREKEAEEDGTTKQVACCYYSFFYLHYAIEARLSIAR